MPTTPTYAFRYPASTNSPNVPLDISNLATDVENYLGSFMKKGVLAATTDGSGLVSISHGLSAAPSVVLFTAAFTTDLVASVIQPRVGAIGPSTIQVVVYRSDSDQVADPSLRRLLTTAVAIHWVAFK